MAASVPEARSEDGSVGGLRLIRRNRAFGALLCSRTVSFTGEATGLVALMLFVADSTGQAIAVSVLLLGAVGIGLVAGFAVSSLGNLLTGLAWAVSAAFTLQAVRGVGIAAMDVATNTLLQRTVPPRLLGRVFGNFYGAVGAAAGLSYLAGGLLLDATSAPAVFITAGAGGLLATALVAWLLPHTLAAGSPAPPGP